MSSYFSPLTNPFTRSEFWGREKELSIIWGRLLSKTPQSVVVIGEPFMGKTRLVKHLMQSAAGDEQELEQRFTFVYLDCKRYIDLVEDWGTRTITDAAQSVEQNHVKDIGNFAAALFWWDLYNGLPGSSQENERFPEPRRNEDDAAWLDATYEISLAIEKWIQHHGRTVIFILDNF